MSSRPVVLDLMGGDAAPSAALAAVDLLRAEGVGVLLSGPAELVGADGLVATSHVTMAEDPVAAVRRRPDCSVRVAARAVADGTASAMVSAGSTGAVVTAARLELGRRPGVRRPVLAVRIPVAGGSTLLVDAGAVPVADAAQLYRAATLGRQHLLDAGHPAPTIGLLNVGTEANKGDPEVRRARRLLEDVPGFVGNVEPGGLMAGTVDLVVTDGFTGNILLKTLEAVAPRSADEDAAAIILGVPGTVLVAHGAARGTDLATAVHTAVGLVAARTRGTQG